MSEKQESATKELQRLEMRLEKVHDASENAAAASYTLAEVQAQAGDQAAATEAALKALRLELEGS